MVGSLILIVWLISIISHMRLRYAIKKQNKDINKLLAYKAPLFPLGPVIVICTIIFLLVGQSFGDIKTMNIIKVIESYIPIVIAIISYFGYKLVKRTKIIKLEDINLEKHTL